MTTRRSIGVFLSVVAVAVMVFAACAPTAAPAPAAPAAPVAPVAPSAPTTAPRPTATIPSLPPTPAPPSAQPTPVPTRAAPSDQPKPGGRLILMASDNTATLDAQQEVGVTTYTITGPAYERLVQFDPRTGDKIVGDMAESWSVSSDGKVYTFKVRQGVKFHNGDPMTADDILFDLQRIIDPPAGVNSKAKPLLLPALDKIQKIDDSTVELRLKFPLAPTLAALTVDSSVIYSKKLVQAKGDMKTDIMGTGPFKMESYTPSVGAELVKFSDFYIKGMPYLDRISIRIVPDSATRVAALRSGQVHLTARGFTPLSPGDRDLVRGSVPTMKFYPSQTPLAPTLFMNVRRPPFSDPRVRQAVSLALDRDAAVKVIAEGEGQIGTILFYAGWGVPLDQIKTWPGFRPQKDQDIAAAKKLMADAGYPNGFDLDLLSRTNRITRIGATFMTDQLQKVGIRAQVKVQEDGIFFDAGRKGIHQAMVYTPAYSTPDPGWLVANYLSPGGSLNFSGNDSDQRIIDLNKAQLSAVDENARKKIIAETEEYALREQVIQIPMVWPYTFIAVAPQVRGYVLGVNDYVNNGNIFQQMWLDK
ncbi:MAG: ABC transporter substrate-binding protein [Dehalococcoidia bacterium]|nr:ABC transporter substrate-binding protein [Dehalococcoidia bacterium]